MLSRSVVHQKSHDTSPSCLFWHQTHMHQAWVGNIENYVTNNANAQTFSHSALFVWLFFYVWLPRCHIVKQFSHLAPVYFFNLYIGLWEIFGLNWNITLNLPLMSMHAFSHESCNHTPKSSTWTSLGIRLYNLYAGYNTLKLSWEAKHPAPQSTLKLTLQLFRSLIVLTWSRYYMTTIRT